MRVPLSLLQEYIDLPESVEHIAKTLTLLGLEVDGIENPSPPFSGVVVGKVVEVSPHKEAKNLQIALVDDGEAVRQIVCGAKNCRKGLTTALAKVGASLPKLSIEASSIRGVLSEGMLASGEELGLPLGGEGIIELPSSWNAGDNLLPLLWDPVFLLSLTPNLGHCMSILGIARELSAAYNRPLKNFSKATRKSGGKSSWHIEVENGADCPFYALCPFEGVVIQDSPFWLQKILLSCGMKPISNVVDITNYILLKRGQPLHAFDLNKIEGNTLFVRKGAKTPFCGLDGETIEVDSNTLTIQDKNEVLALAGILGGKESAISSTTTRIVLEAAHFSPARVRQGMKATGLRTESALRFEKGIDPAGVLSALEEASYWIETLAQGAPGPLAQSRPLSPPQKTLSIRKQTVERLLGFPLSLAEIESILRRLSCEIHKKEDQTLIYSPPSYRNDWSTEVDAIEEIARIYGYNHIPRKSPLAALSKEPHDPLYLLEKDLQEKAVALGLQQILNTDLLSPKLATLAIESISRKVSLLQAKHAKTEEYSILRPSLLPGILQVVRRNLDQGIDSLAGFESGKVYFLEERTPVEIPSFALFLTGQKSLPHWKDSKQPWDFYDLKGLVETLFFSLRLPAPSFRKSSHISLHPHRQMDIFLSHIPIGSFGVLHPEIPQKLGIEKEILFAEISLLPIVSWPRTSPSMRPLPQFPSSSRDWTLPLPPTTPVQTILDEIEKHRPDCLAHAELLDVYEKEDTRHVTFRCTYRDSSRTLSSEEVERAHAHLLSSLLAK